MENRFTESFREIIHPALWTGLFLLLVISIFTYSWFNNEWQHYTVMASVMPFLLLYVPVLLALYFSQLIVETKISRKKKIRDTLLIYFFVGCSIALVYIVGGGIATLVRSYDTDLASFFVGIVLVVVEVVVLIPNYVYFYKKNKDCFQ